MYGLFLASKTTRLFLETVLLDSLKCLLIIRLLLFIKLKRCQQLIVNTGAVFFRNQEPLPLLREYHPDKLGNLTIFRLLILENPLKSCLYLIADGSLGFFGSCLEFGKIALYICIISARHFREQPEEAFSLCSHLSKEMAFCLILRLSNLLLSLCDEFLLHQLKGLQHLLTLQIYSLPLFVHHCTLIGIFRLNLFTDTLFSFTHPAFHFCLDDILTCCTLQIQGTLSLIQAGSHSCHLLMHVGKPLFQRLILTVFVCFRYHVLSLNYPTKVRIFLEIIILTDESLKSTELFPHVHWLHTQEVVKVCMQLTYLCHGLHFYADVLFQLAGTDVTREY